MLKSIIIAIVVAIIVWAVSFDFFFAYKGTFFSFGIAVAAGVIAGLILKAVTPNIGIQILIVAIVTIAATFIASKLIHKEVCYAVAEAKITCNPPDVVPDCFIVNKGTTFKWNTSGLADGVTVTISKFKKKLLGFPFPAHPLTADSYTGDKHKNISATVKNKSGYFKYSLTCAQQGKPDDVRDPMIKVP